MFAVYTQYVSKRYKEMTIESIHVNSCLLNARPKIEFSKRSQHINQNLNRCNESAQNRFGEAEEAVKRRGRTGTGAQGRQGGRAAGQAGQARRVGRARRAAAAEGGGWRGSRARARAHTVLRCRDPCRPRPYSFNTYRSIFLFYIIIKFALTNLILFYRLTKI